MKFLKSIYKKIITSTSDPYNHKKHINSGIIFQKIISKNINMIDLSEISSRVQRDAPNCPGGIGNYGFNSYDLLTFGLLGPVQLIRPPLRPPLRYKTPL